MSRVQAVDKVKSLLSNWKMKALSIEGRLTLLKSVLGSMPIFHMSIFRVLLSVLRMLESIRSHFFNGHELRSNKSTWVKWNSVLASKAKGGLGDSSLYALNRDLMLKWVWRFYSQKTSLWARIIKAIYGDDEKVGKPSGKITRWVWSLESSGEFSVASVRKVIDEKRLSNVNTMTRLIKCVPIKVNVLAWKIKIGALPTRLNISRRGIDINSILCPICDCGVESSCHSFFSCSLARQVARKISLWWDVTYVDVNSYVELVTWMMSLRLTSKLNLMLEGVFYAMWWYLWSYRNKLLFETKAPLKAVIFDDETSLFKSLTPTPRLFRHTTTNKHDNARVATLFLLSFSLFHKSVTITPPDITTGIGVTHLRVWTAVAQGETLMNALQGVVPEDIRETSEPNASELNKQDTSSVEDSNNLSTKNDASEPQAPTLGTGDSSQEKVDTKAKDIPVKAQIV
nr:RNA-directed DNA polymerase, eukaryota [Tanacetum cinerariifolium]